MTTTHQAELPSTDVGQILLSVCADRADLGQTRFRNDLIRTGSSAGNREGQSFKVRNHQIDVPGRISLSARVESEVRAPMVGVAV